MQRQPAFGSVARAQWQHRSQRDAIPVQRLGELTQITDPAEPPHHAHLHSGGLIATITDAQNNVTTYGYDSMRQPHRVIDAHAEPDHISYDSMKPSDWHYLSGPFDGELYLRRIADAASRRTDQNNKTTTYGYDDADRLTAVTDPANNITQYGYDTENNLTASPTRTTTPRIAYDALGWVTQTTFPSTLARRMATTLSAI